MDRNPHNGEPAVKRRRKNKPRNTQPPSTWSDEVWTAFSTRIAANRNSRGGTYYTEVDALPPNTDGPPTLMEEKCHNPTASNNMMVCVNNMEYQRPLHRIRFLLRVREQTGQVLDNEQQCSHLCMDAINVSGRGAVHCTNPDHIVMETDQVNKSRQRCAGWIWIHPVENQPGGFWYPTCVHDPPCHRFTPKTIIPTHIRRNN